MNASGILAELPLLIWGEGGTDRNLNPSPHPSPYGRGSTPSAWQLFRRCFQKCGESAG